MDKKPKDNSTHWHLFQSCDTADVIIVNVTNRSLVLLRNEGWVSRRFKDYTDAHEEAQKLNQRASDRRLLARRLPRNRRLWRKAAGHAS